jgi:DNA-directed RNA polymerase subunit beta'
VLVEGKAIQIHPLVCEAFNADFDGDQMAVHLPLSAEAQAEARVLMLSTNNMLSPASGRPIVTPSQDMVIGMFYLSEAIDGGKGEGRAFADIDEAAMAYELGDINIHTKIKLRVGELAGDPERHAELKSHIGHLLTEEPVDGSALFETTYGRALLNTAFPESFPYINAPVLKSDIRTLVAEVINDYDKPDVAATLDSIKSLGFRFATKAGLTIGLEDVKTPPEKNAILDSYDERAAKVESLYLKGVITDDERRQELIEIWTEATDEVKDAMQATLEAEQFNPIDMMVRSGARGNMMQLRQIAGMRGLVANPKGDIIPQPIKSNFREGLSVLEYFISTHGARKGLADTALRTADSGYLTRRLVDVAQEIIIHDEETDDTGLVIKVRQNGAPIRNLRNRIYGRILAEDAKVGRKLVETADGRKLRAGELVDREALQAIEKEEKLEEVRVRSPLTDQSRYGISKASYGMSLATGLPVESGEAVGIMAAQSIGEPGTQLTMRTFHTGGVAGEDITHGLPRVVELFEARTPKGKALLAEHGGVVQMLDDEEGRRILVADKDQETEYPLPRRARLRVAEGDIIEPGTQLTEGPLDPKEVLEIRGVRSAQRYLVDQVQEVYRSQGVDIHDKHIELVVRQMLRKVRVVNPATRTSCRRAHRRARVPGCQPVAGRGRQSSGRGPPRADGYHQGLAGHGFVAVGGFVPGDHPGAHRGVAPGQVGLHERPQGERHHRQAHPGRHRIDELPVDPAVAAGCNCGVGPWSLPGCVARGQRFGGGGSSGRSSPVAGQPGSPGRRRARRVGTDNRAMMRGPSGPLIPLWRI